MGYNLGYQQLTNLVEDPSDTGRTQPNRLVQTRCLNIVESDQSDRRISEGKRLMIQKNASGGWDST